MKSTKYQYSYVKWITISQEGFLLAIETIQIYIYINIHIQKFKVENENEHGYVYNISRDKY